jgi:hypothetical protein
MKKRLMITALTYGLLSVPAFAQQTTSGFDTPAASNLSLIFANGGQKIGEWNTSALVALGGVQVGQTLVTCDATTAGQIRWNTTNVSFEGCNGTNWQSLGGGASGSLCGNVFVEYDSGNCSQYQPKASCQGIPLLNSCNISALSCPNGYSPTNTAYSWGQSGGLYQYFSFSCVKN